MVTVDANTVPQSRSRWVDVIAGLSIAGLVLPEAVAYAGIANVPPQAGLIGLVAGLACYGIFGTSRFAVVSATSSSAAIVAATTISIAGDNDAQRLTLAAALVLLAGCYFLVAGMAKLGNITDFISKPVLRGFTFGLALVIIGRQLAVICNVHPSGVDLPHFIWGWLAAFGHWNWSAVAVGVTALAWLVLLGQYRRVPGGLLVIGLGILATHYLDLPTMGVEIVGPIHFQVQRPAVPVLPRADWLRLAELAFALVLMLYSESYGSIRSLALKHDDPVTPNRDLLVLGLANLGSGLFGGLPVGAGYSASAANEAAGARSRWAGGVTLLVLVVIVSLLLPFVALTPAPVLAAVVIHGVSHSLRPTVFRSYFRWERDRLVVLASVLAVVSFGVLDGLLVGVALSLIMLLRRFSRAGIGELGRLGSTHDFVNMADHAEAKAIPGVLILRPEQPLFFANAELILGDARRRVVASGAMLEAVILSLEESFDLDGTSIESLLAFIDFVERSGRRLVLARVKHPVHQLLNAVLTPSPSVLVSGLSVDDAVASVAQGSFDRGALPPRAI